MRAGRRATGGERRAVRLLFVAVSALAPLPRFAIAQAPQPVVVPIRVVNNHVHVPVIIEERTLWFILDTGAGISLMNLPTAESLGVKLGGPVGIAGAGPGTLRGARLEGVIVRLAQDTTIWVSPSVAMPMTALNTFEGVPVSGILGHDFISQRVLQIDYAGQRLVLHDAATFRYAGSGVRVPIEVRNNYPHVPAELELKDGTRIAADLIVDVGASDAAGLGKQLVDRNQLLERTAPTIRRQAGRGAGGAMTATLGRISKLHIGGAEVSSPVVAMHGDSAGVFSNDRLFQGNIGGEVLRRFTVYLDYSRNEMIFEPNATHDEPFEVDMSGTGFRPDSAGAGLRVNYLMPDGPAMQAGLQLDDLVTAIDGQPALEYGLQKLRQRLRQPGEIALTVRRDGIDKVIRIPLRRLI